MKLHVEVATNTFHCAKGNLIIITSGAPDNKLCRRSHVYSGFVVWTPDEDCRMALTFSFKSLSRSSVFVKRDTRRVCVVI